MVGDQMGTTVAELKLEIDELNARLLKAEIKLGRIYFVLRRVLPIIVPIIIAVISLASVSYFSSLNSQIENIAREQSTKVYDSRSAERKANAALIAEDVFHKHE
jgi:hypothetical protein